MRRRLVLISIVFVSFGLFPRDIAAASSDTAVQTLLAQCRAAYFRLVDYRGILQHEVYAPGREPERHDIAVLYRKPGFLSLDWQSGLYAGTTLLAQPGWNNGNFLIRLGGWFDFVRINAPLIDISHPFVPSLKDVQEWLSALVALSRRPASDRSLTLVHIRTDDRELLDGQLLLSVPAFLIPFWDNTVAVYEFVIEKGTGMPVALILRGRRGEAFQRLSYTELQVNSGVVVQAFEQPTGPNAFVTSPQAKTEVDVRGFRQHWLRRYAGIRDYTGIWITSRRRGGTVPVVAQVAFKFREPFDVYWDWGDSTALYRQGWNEGRVRVRTTLAGMPVIGDLDPAGFLAEQRHLHAITDFGLNKLMERTQDQLLQGWLQGELEARFLGVQEYTARPCYVFEFVFPNSRWRVYSHYRIVMYWDISRRVPIKLELFDWNDRLAEGHAFHQLRLNVSLDDLDFDAANPRYDFLLFRGWPGVDWFVTGRD